MMILILSHPITISLNQEGNRQQPPRASFSAWQHSLCSSLAWHLREAASSHTGSWCMHPKLGLHPHTANEGQKHRFKDFSSKIDGFLKHPHLDRAIYLHWDVLARSFVYTMLHIKMLLRLLKTTSRCYFVLLKTTWHNQRTLRDQGTLHWLFPAEVSRLSLLNRSSTPFRNSREWSSAKHCNLSCQSLSISRVCGTDVSACQQTLTLVTWFISFLKAARSSTLGSGAVGELKAFFSHGSRFTVAMENELSKLCCEDWMAFFNAASTSARFSHRCKVVA